MDTRSAGTPSRRKVGVAAASTLCAAALLLTAPLTHAANGGAPQPFTNVEYPVIQANSPGGCPFDVSWTATGAGKTIAVPNGLTIAISPRLNVTVTNLSDPTKSVVLNATGAFHQTTDNGVTTTVVTGRNLLTDPYAGMVLALGTFSFGFDAAGTLVQPLTGTGQLVNVCDLIA
jgi:hypothetical protein